MALGPGHPDWRPPSGIPAHGTRRAKPGDRLALKHGARTRALSTFEPERLAVAVAEVDALVQDTPAAHPSFALARAALVDRVVRYRLLGEWLDTHGVVDQETGAVQPAVHLAMKMLSGIERSLAECGLTPTSAARLGVDLARGTSIADELAAARAARERAEARHEGPGTTMARVADPRGPGAQA